MRPAALAIAVSLAWTACSMAGSGAPPPMPIEAGKPFSLRPGQSALADDGSLQVGFEGVTADSRCPKSVQCVWAGDAIVRVWLQRGAGPKETRELHAAPGAAQAVRLLGRELRLVRLDPYPTAAGPLSKQDYVATLQLGRSTDVDVER